MGEEQRGEGESLQADPAESDHGISLYEGKTRQNCEAYICSQAVSTQHLHTKYDASFLLPILVMTQLQGHVCDVRGTDKLSSLIHPASPLLARDSVSYHFLRRVGLPLKAPWPVRSEQESVWFFSWESP